MCSDDQTIYSILVQNAETVALVCPKKGLLSQSETGFLNFCWKYLPFAFPLCLTVMELQKFIFCAESGGRKTAIPVTSLKVGDEIMLRLQGGARHTGIEIQEFIVEK